ncbi:hypothetical protein DFS33DRAFT_1298760 [Desarmillaria ectypa]|nr:hypothetical protein DFS33DRAFT_1298760 [Desarmillaria ectypa]
MREAHTSLRALAMDIDHRTVEKIGRHALHGLGYRLDISPNDWKASVEDLHQFAATCSFPSESVYTRTVINGILDRLEVNAPPGIPLRARAGIGGQGTIQPPSFTDILGIFVGAAYIPTIILKAVEAHPAAPWDVPNDPIVESNTRQIGQRIGPDEHLLSASAKHPTIWNGRNTASGRMVIGQRVALDTQFLSMQEASTWDKQTFWPSNDMQRIQPDADLLGVQEDTQNDLTVRRSAVMMIGQRIRPDAQFLETQKHPSVSWSAGDHRMILQSDKRIFGRRTVAGGLISRGADETSIWAPQWAFGSEYPNDRWSTRPGNHIAF